jgi:hypothetical protein
MKRQNNPSRILHRSTGVDLLVSKITRPVSMARASPCQRECTRVQNKALIISSRNNERMKVTRI